MTQALADLALKEKAVDTRRQQMEDEQKRQKNNRLDTLQKLKKELKVKKRFFNEIEIFCSNSNFFFEIFGRIS